MTTLTHPPVDRKSVEALAEALRTQVGTVSYPDQEAADTLLALLEERDCYKAIIPAYENMKARAEKAEKEREWRPIETAPKAKCVLVALSDGYVGEAYSRNEGDEDDGWWWGNTSPGDYTAEKISPEPTHWMPLPSHDRRDE